MAMLNSRTKFPPGGFQVLIPEAGMKAPFSGSFNEAVDFLFKFRSKNPALVAKHGWSLNIEDIENDVDTYNAQRCIAHGWFNFVDVEGVAPPTMGGVRRGSYGGAVAAQGRAALTGLAIYRELFTGGTQPVLKDEAERRAAICLDCPLNKKGGLREWFVDHVAAAITDLYGVLRDLDLTTSH